MRRLIATAACLAFVACGSSSGSGGGSSKTPTAAAIGAVEPETSLTQLIGPEQLNWEAGVIEMKYALNVSNRANHEITLRQIQIQTVGVEGPYYIPQSSYYFREKVAGGDTRAVEFFAKAVSQGNRYRIDAQSPVSIRVIAFFEAPEGNFRQAFITNLGQSFKQ